MNQCSNNVGENVDTPEIMTLDQAAAWLQLHPVSLRRLAADGMVPGAKVGKEWRFSRAALMDYLGDPAKWQKYKTSGSEHPEESGTQTSLSEVGGLSDLQAQPTKRKPKRLPTSGSRKPGGKLSLVKSPV
jgi:excisionase family DNA binding protein